MSLKTDHIQNNPASISDAVMQDVIPFVNQLAERVTAIEKKIDALLAVPAEEETAEKEAPKTASKKGAK